MVLQQITIEDVRKLGSHLSLEERGMIQALHRQGLSLRKIAAEVGCAHTTVFYELRRGTPMRKSSRGRAPQYTAKRGHKAYVEHRRNSRKPCKIDSNNCESFILTHPYSSWERPQNERHNGLLRDFIPKGMSIERFTDEDILNMADELNQRPRRILGYHSPTELFDMFLDEVYSIDNVS
ncbi:helix-turn-helix domain-containing protein [Selenomonas sp.]|uniref:helix-turn-helix domain-containing protein n=1 Tax=Selenomonas sp. TaxID=2053611 RepID=UPI0025DC565A|nr:helix-turn-helix domain-containing protein [Selenomonas sp.]